LGTGARLSGQGGSDEGHGKEGGFHPQDIGPRLVRAQGSPS
jgi:hypothetical protein